MSHVGPSPAWRRMSTRRLAAGGVALALAAAGVLASTDQGSAGKEAALGARPGAAASTVLATLRARDLPSRLRIGSIGVDAVIGTLGLNRDGTVQVPADPRQVGWYRLGPRPGQSGSAVLLGHVDSLTGPAVFYRLKAIPLGARIQVVLAGGRTLLFTVDDVSTYLNWNFPASAVYRNRGVATLTLVTCGGTYDKARGGYQANVVVTADLDH